MEEEKPEKTKSNLHTIASLRLDVMAAMKGQTWLLLPEGFRHAIAGQTYPLPSLLKDLQSLVVIPIPPRKQDAGCKYLKRALLAYKKKLAGRQSAILDTQFKQKQIEETASNVMDRMKVLRTEATRARDEVRAEAEKAIASMSDLYSGIKKGLLEMIEAKNKNRPYQGRNVTNAEFLTAARIVTQSVGKMGIPPGDHKKTQQAVLDELAAAIKSSQEALDMAPGSKDPETEH